MNTEATSALSTDFVPFVEVERSAPACLNQEGTFDEVCEASVATSLLFCKDSTCEKTDTKSFVDLYVNLNFWIVHTITDTRFSAWKVTEKLITASGSGTMLTLTPEETVEENGRALYKIKVIAAL